MLPARSIAAKSSTADRSAARTVLLSTAIGHSAPSSGAVRAGVSPAILSASPIRRMRELA